MIYEIITYAVTFLILNELWSFHKPILKLSGIRHTRQSLINGLILALACLGAGNIILILNSKIEIAANEIKANMSHAAILKEWVAHGSTKSICMLLMNARMFGLTSLLAGNKANPEESSSLNALERTTRVKAFLFLLFPLNWLQMLLGSQTSSLPLPS